MESFTITTESVTYANKALTLLSKNNIASRIVKKGEKDCGFSIFITAPSKSEVIRLLNSNSIKYKF